ncbi:MAG: hypothetical protein QNJ33_09710 [Crocosphaera sp.]|nr:hypothetical protein [Crocosphaera sp.]
MNLANILRFRDSKESTSDEGVHEAIDILKRLCQKQNALLEGEEPSKDELIKELDQLEKQISSIKHKIEGDKSQAFPRRTFWDGMASVLDISGSYARNLDKQYPAIDSKPSYLKSDKEAIRSDWATIGLDIKQAASQNNEKQS